MISESVISCDRVTKQYGAGVVALRDITFELPAGAVTGLIGRNGSGKTTLLHTLIGLIVPSSGTARTFGQPSHQLTDAHLGRIGCVHQEATYLDWMSVDEHLNFAATFHPRWDAQRVDRLIGVLRLDRKARIARLTPGDLQKLGIILAVAHHPGLLLLDEPVSALDPIARAEMLAFLIELLREDECSIVVSSHVLRDIETIVDHVVCLDAGDLLLAAPLDTLQERFAEWVLEAPEGTLPAAPPADAGIVEGTGGGRQARWVVDLTHEEAARRLVADLRARVAQERTLNLERAYPALLRAEGRVK